MKFNYIFKWHDIRNSTIGAYDSERVKANIYLVLSTIFENEIPGEKAWWGLHVLFWTNPRSNTMAFYTTLGTLGRMMSKVSRLNEKSFLLSIFNTLNTSQKGYIILHDEVYIKKILLYHGKQLFGKSVDYLSLLAQTVLGIMLICLNGGLKFLTKLIPISKLTLTFLFEQS